jgi:putative tryptophan/tyrosine transport system substrate-binding protein
MRNCLFHVFLSACVIGLSAAARLYSPEIDPGYCARIIVLEGEYAAFARSGGLMSYAVDARDLMRRAADYVDRILRGARPADLPVRLPTKFELAINMTTAKALGLNLPPILLVMANEVIE